MANLKEAKLDSIINAFEVLRIKTKMLFKQNEELYITIHNGQGVEAPQMLFQATLDIPLPRLILIEEANNSMSTVKKSRISLLKKFNNTHSKF